MEVWSRKNVFCLKPPANHCLSHHTIAGWRRYISFHGGSSTATTHRHKTKASTLSVEGKMWYSRFRLRTPYNLCTRPVQTDTYRIRHWRKFNCWFCFGDISSSMHVCILTFFRPCYLPIISIDCSSHQPESKCKIGGWYIFCTHLSEENCANSFPTHVNECSEAISGARRVTWARG